MREQDAKFSKQMDARVKDIVLECFKVPDLIGPDEVFKTFRSFISTFYKRQTKTIEQHNVKLASLKNITDDTSRIASESLDQIELLQ